RWGREKRVDTAQTGRPARSAGRAVPRAPRRSRQGRLDLTLPEPAATAPPGGAWAASTSGCCSTAGRHRPACPGGTWPGGPPGEWTCRRPWRTTGGARGTGLALVLGTGAALRRPCVRLAFRRGEGCFSPAVGPDAVMTAAAWNDP